MVNRRGFLKGMGAAAALGGAGAGCGSTPGGGAHAAKGALVDWSSIRGDFLYPSDVGYFNTGTLGASPRPVVEAVQTSLASIEASLPFWDFRDKEGESSPLSGYRPLWDYRRPLAAMLGASAEEIALIQNATIGMNLVAQGLEVNEGDEVLISDQEHPGGECPWLLVAARRGIVVKKVPIGPPIASPAELVDRVARAITPRTRVLVISHLTSALGILVPVRELAALCQERGIISVVDGAQVLGQVRVDLRQIGCDFYIASPHKWLCAPKGTGVLYLRREMQEQVWTTLASLGWNDKDRGAGRFHQYGTGNMSVLEGLRAAVAYQQRIGVETIEARVLGLTKRLREGLRGIRKVALNSPESPELSTAVTNFRVEGISAADLQDRLWDKRLRVRHVGEGVRCGTHYPCTEEEVDRLIARVHEIAG